MIASRRAHEPVAAAPEEAIAQLVRLERLAEAARQHEHELVCGEEAVGVLLRAVDRARGRGESPDPGNAPPGMFSEDPDAPPVSASMRAISNAASKPNAWFVTSKARPGGMRSSPSTSMRRSSPVRRAHGRSDVRTALSLGLAPQPPAEVGLRPALHSPRTARVRRPRSRAWLSSPRRLLRRWRPSSSG